MLAHYYTPLNPWKRLLSRDNIYPPTLTDNAKYAVRSEIPSAFSCSISSGFGLVDI